jgi:hypothetical protein
MSSCSSFSTLLYAFNLKSCSDIGLVLVLNDPSVWLIQIPRIYNVYRSQVRPAAQCMNVCS